MKEKLNKKHWRLRLLSLFCGFLVWLGVVNVADPVMTDTVDVPVEIVNGDVLTKNGLTYEIVGKKTTTISYEVKTTNAYRIRSADFRAYADMTELWSVTGAIPVKVEILNNEQYIVDSPVSKTSAIKIETEPLQKKRFDMKTALVGELEDGYEPGEITLSPGYLYVEGPESLIGQISSAGVEISLEGVNMDTSGTVAPKFYDANGNKIELSSRIESSCESVDYTLQVLRVKNLTLDFKVSGVVADGYRFTGVSCEVKEVPVIGLKSVLASLNTITIPEDVLNLNGAGGNVEKVIDLSNLLPEGVTLASQEHQEMTVVLMVEKLEERMFTADVTEVCYEGMDDRYVYSPIPETVSVRVRALNEEFENFTFTSENMQIDVTDLEPGFNPVTVNISIDPAYEVVYISSCVINITEKTDETETDFENENGEENPTGQADQEETAAAGE